MLNALYKIYFWLVALPVFAVLTLITTTAVIAGCLLGFEEFFSYYPGKWWSKAACILSLCPVRVRGKSYIQKGRSYVFVSNHQGAYDIFLIYGYLGTPIKWMMKKGLAKIPLVGYACRMAGFIFVDNKTARSAQRSVREAEKSLRHGRSLIVFPEGSRSPDGHMGRFKRGAYQIALDRKLPIIPITINGPYDVMPIGSWDVRPHRLEMIIHPPMPPQEPGGDEKEALQEMLSITQKTIYDALWEKYKD